ncbi:DUF1697 domain-containing protein [Saccharopolyspora gloriosae]|uniref:Uncharacterized protein (DUF1697 family) n=1 Tax=Saccharopolyspora gloriosae TaxID=455344 RepID=A0A840NJG2_9PSEU|nr:uncharacterized protein (DUF1697 family) [Saccharopolyspora gloriosae]
MRQVALLRGINLGKHNRIPMAGLRELLARLGFDEAGTHLQSGNAVFSADISAAESERVISAGIAEEFGLDVPVVVRTRDELAAVVAADPLAEIAAVPAQYLVIFLSARPDPAVLAELDPAAFAPDEVRFGEREVYVWCPEGVRNSRVPQSWWERRLGVRATARNWTTVTRLLELANS